MERARVEYIIGTTEVDMLDGFTRLDQGKAAKVQPVHVGTVGPIRFFEHPTRGDEAPLWAKVDGVWYRTEFWDMPTLEELGYIATRD